MNEEYLWDKSGEPDPEIQELEEILGSLRYQPKRLDLLDNNQQTGRRSYAPLIAIAATLVIAVLAGFFWLSYRHNRRQELTTTTTAPVAPAPTIPEVKKANEVQKLANTTPHQETVAVNRHKRTVAKTATPSKEALLAKEQLMTALRLASEKLNLAQRKTQNPSVNQIRNQHKLG
jgi:hypothetical protein